MAPHEDPQPSSAPTARGRGVWWYVVVLVVLILAGVVAALLFADDGDGGGYIFGLGSVVVGVASG